MTEAPQLTCEVSVRADAERTVAPDAGRVQVRVERVAAQQDDAARLLADEVLVVTGALGELGGVAHRAEAPRIPLSWSAHSFQVHAEHDHRTATPTGRHVAATTLAVTVRDFGLLADVLGVLTDRDSTTVQGAWWSVDADNPAWPQVRADAIAAALRKGQDYAAALGGRIERVEQVADAGLLGSSDGSGGARVRARFSSGERLLRGEQDLGPVLEPEPQTITAAIDARFTTTVGPLPAREP